MDRLLAGFGFRLKQSKHRIYEHPDFPDLTISVPRHDRLKKWVAEDAVKLVDDLLSRKEEDEDERE